MVPRRGRPVKERAANGDKLGGVTGRCAVRAGGFVSALVLLACGSGSTEPTGAPGPESDAGTVAPDSGQVAEVFPDPDWVTGSVEAANVDPALLDDAIDYAEAQDTNCLVVTKDGVLISESYWNGWDDTTEALVFSVTKSFSSTLVGIAQDQGLLDIEQSASRYISEWAGGDSEAVTVRHLLSNDSGREWDFVTDYVDMAATADDKTQFAIALGQQHPPGQHWEYNNSAIQTLERVLRMATGGPVQDFAQANLLDPLGMQSSMGTDTAGNAVMFSDLEASCRDLARLGLLMLRGGRWAGGARVVSEEWVKEATTPSTPLNSAYGYLWWLNHEGHWVLPSAPDRVEGDGRIIPGGREDAFAAIGLGSQIIAVDPGSGIVYTRIGGAGSGGLAADELVRELTSRIVAAVVE